MRNSIIPIFIPHLGCPHYCVFCNQRSIATPKEPGTDEVRGIIEEALKYSCNPQISFYGGSFTAIGEKLMTRYLEAAYPFVKNGQCDSIRLSTRPDAIDDKILGILKRYGVKTIELGSQSMNDRVLELSGRGHTEADTVRASHMIKDAGFELILQMMVGLPGSSREDELETARRIRDLKPDGVRIYPTCIIEDTPLYDMFLEGSYKELTVEAAVDICADLLDIFEEAEIPVVRLGLNPTEELSSGGVKGGAYHPALGEMVYSRRFYNKMKGLVPECRPFEIVVPPKMTSIAVGQKRCNIALFAALGDFRGVKTEKDCDKPFIRTL